MVTSKSKAVKTAKQAPSAKAVKRIKGKPVSKPKPVERPRDPQEWLAITGDRVALRTTSCLEAVKFIKGAGLPDDALFVSSGVAALLPGMLPENAQPISIKHVHALPHKWIVLHDGIERFETDGNCYDALAFCLGAGIPASSIFYQGPEMLEINDPDPSQTTVWYVKRGDEVCIVSHMESAADAHVKSYNKLKGPDNAPVVKMSRQIDL